MKTVCAYCGAEGEYGSDIEFRKTYHEEVLACKDTEACDARCVKEDIEEEGNYDEEDSEGYR